jgi:hypothetical protein
LPNPARNATGERIGARPARSRFWPCRRRVDTIRFVLRVPTSLESTTLGDVLGQMMRSSASGALYLVETGNARAGRAHRVHLRDGRPVVVASEGDRIGELLASRGLVDEEAVQRASAHQRLGDRRLFGELVAALSAAPPRDVEACLHAQTRARLDRLFGLEGAQLSFFATNFEGGLEGAFGRAARAASPLSPADYLHGRPRRRGTGRRPAMRGDEPDTVLLGVAPDATAEALRRAFRKRAFELHPDRAENASDRAVRQQLLAKVSAAYHRLEASARR